MDNKLVILVFTFLWAMLVNNASAQSNKDSVEYIKLSKGVMSFKKANSNEMKFKYQGIQLKQLLSQSVFFYAAEHPLTTRSGFLLGWYFKLSDYYKINIYFDKKRLSDNDNVYLNNLYLDFAGNEKIKRIEIVKQRL